MRLNSDIFSITKTENGQSGYNSATIFLYQRASGSTAPAPPNGVLTYTFSTGALTPSSSYNGWSTTMPNDNGNPCWLATAAAISNSSSDPIDSNEWTIQKLVKDGSPGLDGYNAATIYLYQRASTQPSAPTNLTYTFSTDTISGSFSPWQRTVPASNTDKDPCYVTSAVVVSRADSGNALIFAQPTILTEDGKDGKDGQDALEYTIRTDVEEILKFVEGTSTYNNRTYEFSANRIQFFAYDTVRQTTIPHAGVVGATTANLDIKVANYALKDIIKQQYYENYVNDIIDRDSNPVVRDNINYFFYLENFYEKLLDGTLRNQISYYVDYGELEQGTIANGANSSSDYRIRTKDYIKVEAGHQYTFNSNVAYVLIDNFTSEDSSSYISQSGWQATGVDGYTYTIPNDIEYIRVLLAKNNSTGTEIIPSDIEYFTIEDITKDDEIIDNLKKSFDSRNNLNIVPYGIISKSNDDHSYDEIYIEKYLLLKNGLSNEMLDFSINAGSLNVAISQAGLHFDGNGLTVTNSGFRIQTQEQGGTPQPIFYIDPNTHQLVMNGTGTFTGKIEANSGYFNGTITAAAGSIGGFIINENSIESQTKNLQLFSQVNFDLGEIEQGAISASGVNTGSNTRVRTKGYIKVENGHTYIFNSNIPYILIKRYSDQTAESFITDTGWKTIGDNGYSYTVPSNTNYIRLVLAKNSTSGVTNIIPSDVEFFTMIEDTSLIKVENISIGDGGVIDGYLKVGNLSLINPERSNDNAVLKLEIPNDGAYFTLTNEGYIIGSNWSIGKENNVVTARFGKIVAEDGIFNGTINATDGTFSGAISASTINTTTLNAVNFITENVRSMGGSFIFKPTFTIQQIEDKSNSTLEFTLDRSSTNYFSEKEAIDLKDWFEQGHIDTVNGNIYNSNNRIRTKDFYEVFPNERFNCTFTLKENANEITRVYLYFYTEEKSFISVASVISSIGTAPSNAKYMKIVLGTAGAWNASGDQYKLSVSDLDTFYLNRYPIQIVTISGVDTRFGKISSINQNKIQVLFNTTDYNILKAADALDNYQTMTLFGAAFHDLLIGINSDNTSIGNILPPRALVMRSFTDNFANQESGDTNYFAKLLLGDLSSLANYDPSYKNLTGYGLYANNVYLHGSLITTDDGNSTFAGVNTQRDVPFNYAAWSGKNSSEYANDRIVFWGGANGYDNGSIQVAPFIVTDKGNIFARSGEFKGTVISDSVITQSIIKAPIIYGSDESSNTPSLKIYDTNGDKGGISFYKKINNIDAEYNENDDEETLNINTTGFVHKNIKFIGFNDSNNLFSILFNGTQYNAGTSLFKQNEISDGKAKIELINSSNTKLSYNTRGVEINNESINNFGGYVKNQGTMSIYTTGTVNGQTVNTQELNYKVLNGYYCLYVTDNA